MAELKEVIVPDIGGDEVQIIEVCIAIGDEVAVEDSLITVESDKATMDIPAPFAGTIAELKVAVGDKISEGGLIALITASQAEQQTQAPAPEPKQESEPEIKPEPSASEPTPNTAATTATNQQAGASVTSTVEVAVPDIGDATDVDIIEVLVNAGDSIEMDQGLITLETDKATMDVPAPISGKVVSMAVNVGDKVSQGNLILTVETTTNEAVETKAQEEPTAATTPTPTAPAAPIAPTASQPVPQQLDSEQPSTLLIFASPAVRRLSREFGADLTKVQGSGRKGRILKEDVQAYIKSELSRPKTSAASGGGGLQVIAPPKVDFAKFGEVEEVPLTRIQKISGPNLHRNWVTIPHVTQFDEADITELEAFRKQQNELAAKRKTGVKITPLVFMIKAAAKALQQFPVFNSSLSADGESLIKKHYYHIGIAVDTPNGLVVPVVRDVDKKGILELSSELMEISAKSREGKLKVADMQGSCFTISSLGGIGGTAFTPIVNYPDVAILGVSKSELKPKWNGKDFEPRLMLPLSLSYDHRVIDGAMAARFSVTLSGLLSDIRTLVL